MIIYSAFYKSLLFPKIQICHNNKNKKQSKIVLIEISGMIYFRPFQVISIFECIVGSVLDHQIDKDPFQF